MGRNIDSYSDERLLEIANMFKSELSYGQEICAPLDAILNVKEVTDENAKLALEQLKKLKGCQMHSSVLLSQVDEKLLKKLGINLTCEPRYQTKKLYHN